MAFDEASNMTNGMSQLSTMDEAGPSMSASPSGPAAPSAPTAGQQSQGPGGPGPDTPQEQQALQLLMQGAMMMRRATEIEPSIRYLIDDLLQKAYLGVTKHYGLEQEGKLALQQAKLRSDRNRAVALTGPPRPRGGAPTGGPPPGGAAPIA